MITQAELYQIKKMPIGSPELARRFLEYMEQHPDLSRFKDISQKITAAKNIGKLKGDEIKQGARSLQDECCTLDGAFTSKMLFAHLPNENQASMRVCLSRLVAEGVMEKLAYGVYWNKKGTRPTEQEIASARYDSSKDDKIKNMTAEQLLEVMKAKLPARNVRIVLEAL